ncbi:MAG: c-type cytochrome biogenesis protein CcsB [Deltaproteobacteria bacterium]|nr:MAG: c-type cytochrome biogenesis protein CcsB [Deltaproteobacteria bacterium]
MSAKLFGWVTFVYALAAVLFIARAIFHREGLRRFAFAAAIVGLGMNLAGFIFRWVESYQLDMGHAPLSNMYESLVFFALVLTLIYLVVEFRFRQPFVGLLVSPLPFIAMAYASLPHVGKEIKPLIPALKSNWLITHVITCFLGYAGFSVAFAIGILYLIRAGSPAQTGAGDNIRLPSMDALDELMHQLVAFGFIFLTLGIITGAIWANSAWSRYWSWDPKETWALITWFVYAIMLHVRLVRGWQGRRIAVFSIVGFAAVLFTYFGVNYLPGLHSYGAQ